MIAENAQDLTATARALALDGYTPPGEQRFESEAAWQALKETGTRLWLDTGDLEAARKLWCAEFSNLTTNNTLVNKEVQKGLFDEVIPEAARALRAAKPGISDDDLILEVGFVINCRTALRLVEAFDATVSVELHPGMAADAALSLEYGRRYFAVCPERFIVKVPLTPAGYLAAQRLAADGIPVNYTLGFSARQNVVAAAFSRTAFVNVFMGRLNSFVADAGQGDGEGVGERTTLATQNALRAGRAHRGWETLLIGASTRSAQQLFDLAGLDIFTIPTGAAEEFVRAYHAHPRPLPSMLDHVPPVLSEIPQVLDPLWTVDDAIYALGEALAAADTSGWGGREFAGFVRDQGITDFFHPWTAEELARIQADGKIPSWEFWGEALLSGRVALDDLMTVSALYSFVKDQEALDSRIRRLLPSS